MTDYRNDPIVVELLFGWKLPLSAGMLELFADGVNTLVAGMCWFGAEPPPIKVMVSDHNHFVGGKRSDVDVCIMLTTLGIRDISPEAAGYVALQMVRCLGPFGLGVALFDNSRHLIARCSRSEVSCFATH